MLLLTGLWVAFAGAAFGQTLGEALDNTALRWTTGGNASWYGQTSYSYFGGDAARSGAIGHSLSTWMQTTVEGPSPLSFYWGVSSEPNDDCLTFYMDGVIQNRISGSVGWQQQTYSISAGTHTLKWEYSKDGSGSTGSDCGWVDKVEWSGHGQEGTPYRPEGPADWADVSGPPPSARYGHAMTYDSTRSRVVLFGGYNGSYLNDTWEWDGTEWRRISTTTAPSARSGHAMAYDSARSRVVLFGGSFLRDTWEWDGTVWQQIPTPTAPSERGGHAMAYDSVRGRVVLFGGSGGSDYLGDTWEWDGTVWRQISTPLAPSARSVHAMAYDSARGRVVLFGGYDGSDYLGDTWEWDGTQWRQISTPLAPSARQHHAMAYDSARGRVVLFGGQVGYLSRLNDTWEWDGTVWRQISTPLAPSARSFHAMAYDSAGGRVVLFGGLYPDSYGYGNDTWEWDGTVWRRREMTTPTAPSAREKHAMAHDSTRGRVVLFGGYDYPDYLNDTWEWDGTQWDQIAPPTSPPAGTAYAMTHNSTTGKELLYGNNSLWSWDGASYLKLFEGSYAAFPPDGNGYIKTWILLGMFSEEPGTDFLSGSGGEASVWPRGGQTMGGRSWFAYSSTRTDGRVDFIEAFGSGSHCLAYACMYVYSPTAQTATLSVGHDDGVRVWVNDARVMSYDTTYSYVTHSTSVNLRQGVNRLLVKLDQGWLYWLLGVRLTGANLSYFVNAANPATCPFPTEGSALAHNPATGKTLLFGGNSSSETWEWNGSAWEKKTPATAPSIRTGHTMVYDEARNRILLFGGYDGNYRGDTWEWDGTEWRQISTAPAPSARSGHAMACDSTRGRVVLFGGYYSIDGYFYDLNDTWEWDGTQWRQILPPTAPSARYRHAMAYDGVRSRVVLFGGWGNSSGRLNDTWEWVHPLWAGPLLPARVDVAGSLPTPAVENAIFRWPASLCLARSEWDEALLDANTLGLSAVKATRIQTIGAQRIALLADSDSGLVLADLTNPAAPALLKTIFLSGDAGDVDAAGGYAYVAEGPAGFAVADMDPPASASKVAEKSDHVSDARGIAVNGNYLYIADYTAGLKIFNVSNPANPVFSGQTASWSGTALDVVVVGNTAYVANGLSGLTIVDVTNKAAPSIVKTVDTAGLANSVAVKNGYAYVADGSGSQTDSDAELAVVDVDPAAGASVVRTVELPKFWGSTASARGVCIEGNVLYVATGAAGVHILHLSTPENPILLGNLVSEDPLTDCRRLDVSNGIVCAAGDGAGLQVFEGAFEMTGLTVLTTTTLSATIPAGPRHGEYDVILTDSEGRGDTLLRGFRVNQLPGAPQATLGPALPRTTDNLLCTVTTPSADPDPQDAGDILYRYRWQKRVGTGGEWQNALTTDYTAQTTASLASSYTAKGQYWRCVVNAKDRWDESAVTTTGLILILNMPPQQPGIYTSVANNSTSPRTLNDLNIRVSACADADGDSLIYWVRWFKNGVEQADRVSTLTATGIYAMLPNAATAKHELWRVEVTPFDGEAAGTPAAVEWLVKNTPPAGTVVVSIENQPIRSSDELVCNPRFEPPYSDPDGDVVTFEGHCHWYKKVGGLGNWVEACRADAASSRSLIVPADVHTIARGDMVRVVCTAWDGENEGAGGEIQASNPILNGAPSAPILSLLPNPAHAGQTLHMVWMGGGIDPDGDAVTTQTEWYQNGVKQTDLANQLTVPGSRVFRGDTWTARMRLNDGELNGPWGNTEALIQDALPADVSIPWETLP